MRAGADAGRRVALIAFFTGILAGAFGGMLGVGGGVVMVPLLSWLAGLSQHEAHAASLTGVVATGIGGAVTYAGAGAVDLTIAVVLASIAIVTAYLAASYSTRVPERLLRVIFGIFLVISALLLFMRNELLGLRAPQGPATIVFLIVTGIVVGGSSGLLGIGGGALMVPLLVIGLGMSQHLAQGTSLAAMVPAGVSGTIAHVRHGNLRRDAVLGLVPGVIIGSYTGGRLALGMPSATLRVVFAVVLIILGINYMRDVRRPVRKDG